MTPSSISLERKIRSAMPVIRFLQSYMPLPASRWMMQQSISRAKLAAGVTRQAASAVGISSEWLIPQNSAGDQVLLYLHGGGFVYGLTPQHLEMVSYLAQKMGVRSLMLDYRLAPEHPYPAALDDCVSAYRWLLNQGISAQNIALAGDSAGGNLVITTMMKLRDSGAPLPAAAACLSPVGNLSDRNSASKGIRDPLLPPKAMKFYNTSYVAHSDSRDPLISPVFGDFRGLPPLLVHAGEDEILRDDAVCIQEAAKAAGVDVRLEIYPRMWHVWQLYQSLPQAVQSLEEIAGFLQSHLRRSAL